MYGNTETIYELIPLILNQDSVEGDPILGAEYQLWETKAIYLGHFYSSSAFSEPVYAYHYLKEDGILYSDSVLRSFKKISDNTEENLRIFLSKQKEDMLQTIIKRLK